MKYNDKGQKITGKYEITNAVVLPIGTFSDFTDDENCALSLSKMINSQAKRGLRPFSEIIVH